MIAAQTDETAALPTGPHEPRTADRHLPTDELFRTYARYVARLLVRMGVRPDALDDAVQEVFLAAHRNGGYAPGAAKPSTYLARIAMHTALSERRRVRVRGSRFAERPPDELEGAGCDPLRAMETQESLCSVDRALAKLSPALRATLWLADAEGESCVAIAAATDVPVGTVYWRLDRARKQFREAMRRSDASSTPRRALGLLFPWWEREVDCRALLGRHAHALLGRAREALASPATTATLAGAIGGAKGMVALGTVCMGVLGGLVVSPVSTRQPVAPAVASFEPAASARAAAEREPEPSVAVAPEGARAPEVARPTDARPAPVASRSRREGKTARAQRSPSAPPTGVSTREADRTLAWLGAEADRALAATDSRIALEPESEPASTPAQAPTAQASPSEAAQVARAVRLLAKQPGAALAAVRALPAHEAGGFLQEEREYVEVMALLALGEREQGAARADAFLRAHPASALGRTIRQALQR